MSYRAAMSALASGRASEAVALLAAHLHARSRDAEAWFAYGYALRQEREFPAAITAYRRALACGFSRPEEIHVNIAVIFSEHLLDMAKAECELGLAVQANSHFIPAWLNLGVLKEDVGDHDGAMRAFERVLALEPLNARALARKSAILVHQGLADEAVALIDRALARTRGHDDREAELQFARASACDALGRYREAWAAAEAGNRLRWRCTPGYARFDPVRHRAWTERIIAMPVHYREPDPSVPDPVFICGLFRSGSTLAERLLAANSDIVAGGEFDLIPALIARHLPGYPRSGDATARSAPVLREEYISRAHAALRSNGRFSDKRCDNFLHMGLMAQTFPDSLIVHTHRERRDNVVSLFFGDFDFGAPYTNRMDDIVAWCDAYDALMRHWRARLGKRIVDLSYDDLVRDPASVLRQLFASLDLAVPDGGFDLDAKAASTRTMSVWQVRQPLHANSSGRWRNYASELAAYGL